MRELNEQDRQALLQSDENYYNSKRANSNSFQNFIRILIGAFLGAFLANTSWDSLHYPIIAYTGTAFLLLCIILNIITYLLTQKAFDQCRDNTHKAFDEKNPTYIEEMPLTHKIQEILSIVLIIFLILSIVICPTSYIYEKSLGPKEVKEMAKKQQSNQQTSEKVGVEKNERLWNTPARPITPTPDTAPSNTTVQPPQPAQSPQPAQPEQTPAQPPPNSQPSREKDQ